jgi:hypothetical protein
MLKVDGLALLTENCSNYCFSSKNTLMFEMKIIKNAKMKKVYSLFVALATTASVYAQTTITQWDFDDGTTDATTGSGTAAILVASSTPTFPSGNPSSGKSWRVSGFPSQGSDSGTAGFRFATSTEGYTGITVSMDMTGTNAGSKYFQMQYTVDGSEWDDVGTLISIEATSVSGWTSINNMIPVKANNSVNFALRVVSVFDPENNDRYTAIGSSSNYTAGGAIRVDNVTISGIGNTLSVSDMRTEKSNFIKNSFIKNEGITFGVQVENIKIYNMVGQIVKEASVKENETLDISELQKGNYFVIGIVNNQQVSQKILKD